MNATAWFWFALWVVSIASNAVALNTNRRLLRLNRALLERLQLESARWRA